MRTLAAAIAVIVLCLGAAGCATEDLPEGAECRVADDCRLVRNCCYCMGLPVDEQPPACDLQDCLVDECMGLFGTTDMVAVCDVGVCDVQPL